MGNKYFTPEKPPKTRYVFVGQGLHSGTDGTWFTLYKKWPYVGRGTGTHRLKSPSLPERPTKEEAQADLDKYAESHGFIDEMTYDTDL